MRLKIPSPDRILQTVDRQCLLAQSCSRQINQMTMMRKDHDLPTLGEPRQRAQDVGADRFTVYTPTIYFGKGFGDLPQTIGWARPFVVTGQFGYAIPGTPYTTTTSIDPDSGDQIVDTQFHPRVLMWGGSLQYSMPYLKSAVVDLGLPDFFNHLIPLVEASLQTPVSNTFSSGTVTTGTINPGVIWVGQFYQLGIEATIPINRQSGTGVGAIGQLHLFLDDIGPNSIGKPLFGNSINVGRPVFGN